MARSVSTLVFIVGLFVVCATVVRLGDAASCTLPAQWAGKWFQNKDMDLLNINKTHFINRGTCLEQKQDKFLFYESKEECYRCVFIMQKHPNVLQYRASYCTEQSDFFSNCQNLSPESELVTIYRDSAPIEKCPIGGLYLVQTGNGGATAMAQHSGLGQHDDELIFKSSKCDSQDSSIMQCSDPSMLKLQFGKCSSMPAFIVNCMAHWTEGNMNYLIGRVSNNGSQKPSYRCLVYTETSPAAASGQSHQSRRSSDMNVVIGSQTGARSSIQMAISPDEYCRTLEGAMDEQFSYSFTQVEEPQYQLSSPSLLSINELSKHRVRRSTVVNSTSQEIEFSAAKKPVRKTKKPKAPRNSKRNHHFPCRFPKWLNKKWRNLKQSKLFALDPRLDSLLVLDEKNSLINNKYTCHQIKSRKPQNMQVVVRSLNGCSSGYQCLTISSKSEYVLEIKFGKVSHKSSAVDCNDNFVSQEFVYVETNFGVSCPLRNGIYEKLYSNSFKARHGASKLGKRDQDNQQPCRHLTQTQTLQIGCLNEQQYSLKTKLCYPNNQYKPEEAGESALPTSTASSFVAAATSPTPPTAAYTQLESEINLVCLGHWQHEGNHVIVSRTMSNEILCSIWAAAEDGKFLQLLEIDSNCNYNAKKINSNSKINYGFMFVSECNPSGPGEYQSSVSASLSNSQAPASSSSLAAADTVDPRRAHNNNQAPSSVQLGNASSGASLAPSRLLPLLALCQAIFFLILAALGPLDHY